jgi:hypothetical protein
MTRFITHDSIHHNRPFFAPWPHPMPGRDWAAVHTCAPLQWPHHLSIRWGKELKQTSAASPRGRNLYRLKREP